jgi:hypothetical protein
MTMLTMLAANLPDHNALRVALFERAAGWRKIGAPPGVWLLDEFLARHGESFERRLKSRLPYSGRPKECFGNAMRLVTSFPRVYRYCEGYLYDRTLGIAFLHAWVVNQRGEMAEPTTTLTGGQENYLYIGLSFTAESYAGATVTSSGLSTFDTGRGVNWRLIYAHDPSLKELSEIGKKP